MPDAAGFITKLQTTTRLSDDIQRTDTMAVEIMLSHFFTKCLNNFDFICIL